jgi:hypothetical protein
MAADGGRTSNLEGAIGGAGIMGGSAGKETDFVMAACSSFSVAAMMAASLDGTKGRGMEVGGTAGLAVVGSGFTCFSGRSGLNSGLVTRFFGIETGSGRVAGSTFSSITTGARLGFMDAGAMGDIFSGAGFTFRSFLITGVGAGGSRAISALATGLTFRSFRITGMDGAGTGSSGAISVLAAGLNFRSFRMTGMDGAGTGCSIVIPALVAGLICGFRMEGCIGTVPVGCADIAAVLMGTRRFGSTMACSTGVMGVGAASRTRLTACGLVDVAGTAVALVRGARTSSAVGA